MKGSNARNGRALVCALALAALAMWVPRAVAYESYDDVGSNDCAQCHPNFNGGGLHTDHMTDLGIVGCLSCHDELGGDKPVLTYSSNEGNGYGCTGCHGRDYGETSPNSLQPKATGYGLRQYHANNGVPGCLLGCHVGGNLGHPNPLPAILAETVPPPYYGQPSNNLTDPCDSLQEDMSFDDPDTVGLDNDGNGSADAADPACAAPTPTETPTTSATPATPTPTSTPTSTIPVGSNRVTRVYPGDSIQAAVDATAPGGKVIVFPGTYVEDHGGQNAVTVNKDGIRLIGRSRRDNKVILQAGPGQKNGIVIAGSGPGSRVNGSLVRGFTVQGFPNNGIMTQYVDNFKIIKNVSIDNLENGIWPTLSANGLVKRNVAYGSLDSALWVEASENIRVIRNEFYDSPTGLEITVSKNVVVKRNHVHHNTIGIGLYHPSAASLPPLGDDGDWEIYGNYVHDNNAENLAPPGGMVAELPPGGGILVMGVDRVNIKRNRIENNDFFGIALVDYCLVVDGTDFNCIDNPPDVESSQDDNVIVKNDLVNNGNNPPDHPFAFIASDLVLLGGTNNCFEKNNFTRSVPPREYLPECD